MDFTNILAITWDWCAREEVQGVFHLIKSLLDILRYAIPIILIVMTSLDIIKKVINPEDKEGQKKIMIRLIAAVIIFTIPIFIKIVFRVIDWGSGRDGSYENAQSGLSRCWR